MHYLHPRSRTTGTLFTTTLAISFAVVALPHLLPCPVDRRQFADSYETPDGRIMRRRKKRAPDASSEPQQTAEQAMMEDSRPKRECPVPKPGGLVGHIMGFKNPERPKPVEVEVQRMETSRTRQIPSGSKDGL